jgi:predicted nuclease of predicted toxin-antitoxin system
LRFLADECCDYAAVRALRSAGHEVETISELAPKAEDGQVMDLAANQGRILVTEDKDFGQLVYAAARHASGVILLRFPGNARGAIGPALVSAVERLGEHLYGSFVVVRPGNLRISRNPD